MQGQESEYRQKSVGKLTRPEQCPQLTGGGWRIVPDDCDLGDSSVHQEVPGRRCASPPGFRVLLRTRRDLETEIGQVLKPVFPYPIDSFCCLVAKVAAVEVSAEKKDKSHIGTIGCA